METTILRCPKCKETLSDKDISSTIVREGVKLPWVAFCTGCGEHVRLIESKSNKNCTSCEHYKDKTSRYICSICRDFNRWVLKNDTNKEIIPINELNRRKIAIANFKMASNAVMKFQEIHIRCDICNKLYNGFGLKVFHTKIGGKNYIKEKELCNGQLITLSTNHIIVCLDCCVKNSYLFSSDWIGCRCKENITYATRWI